MLVNERDLVREFRELNHNIDSDPEVLRKCAWRLRLVAFVGCPCWL